MIDLLLATGCPAEALSSLSRTKALAEQKLAIDPNNSQAKRDLALVNEREGNALVALGNFSSASNAHRNEVAICQDLIGNDKTNTRYSRDLAGSYFRLGRALTGNGTAAEALEMVRQSQAILDSLLLKEPGSLYLRRELAEVLHLSAQLLATKGLLPESRELTARAFSLQKPIAENPEAAGYHLNEYAWPLLICEPADMRDPAAALPYAKLAAERTRGNDPNILKTLALAYHLTGDQAAAIQTAKKALALLPTGESGRSVLRRDLEELIANAEKTVGNRVMPKS